jgi:Glycosyl transferase family 11
VHIRRGDYVNLPENKSIFPCLNNNYYIEALRKLKGIKKVVLFSDEYMEENFFPKNVELNIIKAEKLEDFEEFLLMTRFKNYIIANSTFSFWGAILSQSIEKVLIGPKKWSFIEDENMKWNENLSKMNFSFVNL